FNSVGLCVITGWLFGSCCALVIAILGAKQMIATNAAATVSDFMLAGVTKTSGEKFMIFGE
ncbi:MAG: hypothetical protein ACJ703_08810, partial [Nitrososphaera sp.]